MELIAIIGAVIALVVAYFCLGILLKFIWGWWILALGSPILIVVGLATGWVGALVCIFGFCLLLVANNKWQGTNAYIFFDAKLDKTFHLSDT